MHPTKHVNYTIPRNLAQNLTKNQLATLATVIKYPHTIAIQHNPNPTNQQRLTNKQYILTYYPNEQHANRHNLVPNIPYTIQLPYQLGQHLYKQQNPPKTGTT